MSLCDLSVGCPFCGDKCGPFHIIKRGDCEKSINCPTFVWGYICYMCSKHWQARESDKADHPSDFVIKDE